MIPSSPVRRSSPSVRQRADSTQLASSPPPYIGGERRGGHHDRDQESSSSSPKQAEPLNGAPTRQRRRPLSARLHSLGGQAKNGAYDRAEEDQLIELLDLFDTWVQRRRLDAHKGAAS